MQIELQKIWQNAQCTVLFITHSITEAIFLADRVVVMSSRPGYVKKELSIDLPRPRTREMFTSDIFRQYEKELKACIWDEEPPALEPRIAAGIIECMA